MMRVMKLCSIAMTAALMGSCGVSCSAQDWAKAALAKSPRHGEFVTVPEANGRKLQVWVVYPQVKAKAPVVVMIHEIFGLSDWAQEMADELAEAGYIVVEPDLLSGLGPTAAAMAAPASPGAPMDHDHMGQGGAGAAYVPMASCMSRDSAGAEASPSCLPRIAATSAAPLSSMVRRRRPTR